MSGPIVPIGAARPRGTGAAEETEREDRDRRDRLGDDDAGDGRGHADLCAYHDPGEAQPIEREPGAAES